MIKKMYGFLWIGLFFCAVACGTETVSKETFPSGIPLFDDEIPDGGLAEPVADCIVEPQFNNNFSPSLGGDDGVEVEVVNYSSFYCIHCADFYAYSHALWRNRSDFRKRARIYFHHASYYYRHRAAVAAYKQGEGYFWELHDYIYDHLLTGEGLSDDKLKKYVKDNLKLDMEQFNRDVDSDETYAFLKWDYMQGDRAGVMGTPTTFVCGDNIGWVNLEDEVADRLK